LKTKNRLEAYFFLINYNSDIEEERRLMYVAITRAKKYAFLSSIESIIDSYKKIIS